MFKHTLECIGIDSSRYNGHSFRIGAATVHMEDHLIKVLGRWVFGCVLQIYSDTRIHNQGSTTFPYFDQRIRLALVLLGAAAQYLIEIGYLNVLYSKQDLFLS